MKRKVNVKLLTVMAGLACLSTMASAPGVHEWQFPSNANPATDADGDTVTIQTGAFASGWQDGNSPLAIAGAGYWDLGKEGTMTCDFGAGKTGVQQITMRVTQWWDGGIYQTFATVQASGAQVSVQHPDTSHVGALGGWVEDKVTITGLPGDKLQQIMVTAGANGALVSRVVVDTSTTPIVPLVLSVQPLSGTGQVELSWPQAAGTAAIESTANPADSQSWTAFSGVVELVGDRYSVKVSATEAGRYFRLKR